MGGFPFPPMGGENGDDPFINMLNNFSKDLLSNDPNKSEKAMEGVMNEFYSFLKENETDGEMKNAIDSLVKDIISKD